MDAVESMIAREIREKVFMYDPHHQMYKHYERRQEVWVTISNAVLRRFPILEGLNDRKFYLYYSTLLFCKVFLKCKLENPSIQCKRQFFIVHIFNLFILTQKCIIDFDYTMHKYIPK